MLDTSSLPPEWEQKKRDFMEAAESSSIQRARKLDGGLGDVKPITGAVVDASMKTTNDPSVAAEHADGGVPYLAPGCREDVWSSDQTINSLLIRKQLDKIRNSLT